MCALVHNIYQTNPAFLIRIWLSILCFNTVIQWEVMTQSCCRKEIEKYIQKKCQGNRLQSNLCIHYPNLLYIDLKITSLWYLKAKLETSCIYLCGFEVFGIGSTFMSLKSVTWDPPDPWHPPPLLLQLSRVLIPTNYHLGRCWWRQMAGCWLVRTAQLLAHANTRTLVRRNMLSDTPGHR